MNFNSIMNRNDPHLYEISMIHREYLQVLWKEIQQGGRLSRFWMERFTICPLGGCIKVNVSEWFKEKKSWPRSEQQ